MTKLFSIFLFVMLFSFQGYGNFQRYSNEFLDSIALVLEQSDRKEDFEKAFAIVDDPGMEQNTLSRKNLIYIATSRSKQLGFEYVHGRFLLRKSMIETIHGNYATAMSEAREALQVLSVVRSYHTQACYNTIAGILSYQGDPEMAIKCVERAFAICEAFKDHPEYEYGICNNHLMLGYIYISHGEFEKGKVHAELALALAEKNDLTSSTVYAKVNLSKIYLAHEEYDSCLTYQYEALEFSREKNAYNLEALCAIRIAETYYAAGDYNQALEAYKEGEQLAIRQNLSEKLVAIYKSIYELYLLENDLVAASAYQSKYIALFEAQKKRERDEQLVLLQVRFKLNDKNAQINSLAIEKKHEQERNKLLQITVFVAITGSILLIIIILLVLNRSRLRRKIGAERQDKELARYQMTALKSQMNPHFTFNALNSIQDLILREKSEDAYTYISKFADLVRKTLNHSDQDFIDIEDEFASLRVYLALEQLRFQEDLTIKLETNNISGIAIPPLLIQPFIENALKHGLLHKKGAKHLCIDFKLKKDLICTVKDNGIGRQAAGKIQSRRSAPHKSFALKSIEGRFEILKKLYGKSVGVTFIDLDAGSDVTGTTVIISLPYKNI